MAREREPRRESRTAKSLWDNDDFVDINSHSDGEPPRRDPLAGWEESLQSRPARPPRERQDRPRAADRGRTPAKEQGRTRDKRRQPPQRDRVRAQERPARQGGRRAPAPVRGRDSRRPAGREAPGAGRPQSGERPRGRPQTKERRRKKPMSLFRRRLLVILAVLAMAAGTLFLVESLLLRVTAIQVTGDQVYAQEDILSICGYKPGDNLLLIPIDDREERIETQMPYVARAKISRRIPGTIQIEITAARPVCSLQAGGGWYVVDGAGKVLEARADPYPGVMQVVGLTPTAAQPGYQLGVADEQVAGIFREILEAIDQLEAAGRFTRLDLTDTEHISLWYEDRVEFLLGGPVELAHKLQYGCGLFDTSKPDAIQPEETGQLELSYLPESKRAFFNAGAVDPGQANQPAAPDAAQSPAPGEGDSQPQTGGDGEDGGDSGGGATQGRGADIPDQPYTGG